MSANKVNTALIIVESLLNLAGSAIKAIRGDDIAKVGEILPESLATEIKRSEAERRAREKFGE